MNGAYFDLETYPNFLSMTFIDMATPQSLVDSYIDADIKKDKIRKLQILKEINHKVFVVFAHPTTNAILRNDILAFYEFIPKVKILVGFNSVKFDNLIIDHLIIHQIEYSMPENYWLLLMKMYGVVESIIANNHTNYKYLDDELRSFIEPYMSLDLYSCLLETVERKSLKQIGIILKWYRIQDLPIKSGSLIKESEVEDILDYNFNDGLLTRHTHLSSIDEINLRVDIGNEYKINLLSANRSKIAEKLLSKFYSENTGLKYYQFKDKRTHRTNVKFGDIINPKIRFDTPELRTLHQKLMNTTYYIDLNDTGEKSKFGETVLFRDKGYKLGVGGLHSVDRPYLYTIDPSSTIMRDADVTSYYPNLVLNEQVCPAHIAPVAFMYIVNMVVHKRTEAKHLAKKYKGVDQILYKKNLTAADALKIVANSGLFGFFGSSDKWLFDIKCTYQTTLNGQLYLLMLIEQMEENGIEVISANTDGIVCRFDRGLEGTYNQICADWQNAVNLSLEFTDYCKYVRTSVNDYIAIKSNYLNSSNRDDVKFKGDFISVPNIKKGYNAPIVAIALDNYYVDNIPFEETIRSHRDIYDFCISVKTGEGFKKEIHSLRDGILNIESLSKNLRYFVSTNGGTLLKQNDETTSQMLKGSLVTAFNDYFPVEKFEDYKINYNYYLKRAGDMKLKIDGVYDKPRTTRRLTNRASTKGVKNVGRMFDGI